MVAVAGRDPGQIPAGGGGGGDGGSSSMFMGLRTSVSSSALSGESLPEARRSVFSLPQSLRGGAPALSEYQALALPGGIAELPMGSSIIAGERLYDAALEQVRGVHNTEFLSHTSIIQF